MQREWMEGLNRIFIWFSNLAYLNLLWIAGTLLGLILFGLAPSTAALFAVIRKLIQHPDEKVPLTKTFFSYYKQEFWKSKRVFWPLVLIGIVLYGDLYILSMIDNQLAMVFRFLTYILIIVYLIVSVFLFPVYSHYDLKAFQYFKQALLIGVIRPLHLLFIIIVIAASYYVMIEFGPLLLFFSISFPAFIVMKVGNGIFSKLRTEAQK